MDELLKRDAIDISVPIQHRTKTWVSISDKLQRHALELPSVLEIRDLIGIRFILQFRRDINKVCEMLSRHFVMVDREDTGVRLHADQFGYSSIHLIIQVPEAWSAVPTLAGFADFSAEVQVRTTAQHIWASASHLLQYKREDAVPAQLRRSMYRVSALLETVDLEFERVLADRGSYIEHLQSHRPAATSQLNVEVLKQVLDELLPELNKTDDEDYGDVLDTLVNWGILDVGQLRDFIGRFLDAALARDKEIAAAISTEWAAHGRPAKFPASIDTPIGSFSASNAERIERGVFYTHAGLISRMLTQNRNTSKSVSRGDNLQRPA
jgi:ppGpp synthetase/RelA/SpoT-type nucleotidyltranferase